MILNSLILRKSLIAVVAALGTQEDNSCWPLIQMIRNTKPEIFTIIYSNTAQDNEPKIRLECFKNGAKMVTCYPNALKKVLEDLKIDHTTDSGTGAHAHSEHRVRENRTLKNMINLLIVAVRL